MVVITYIWYHTDSNDNCNYKNNNNNCNSTNNISISINKLHCCTKTDIFVIYPNNDSDNNINNNTKRKMQTIVCVGVTVNQYSTFLL